MRKLNRQRNRDGASMVEFVVVVPVFFSMLLAGIEFACVGTIRSTAHNAAYEAARKIVIPGANRQEAIDEATRIMGVVGVNTLNVDVTPATINEDTESVNVTVTIPYASNAVFTPFFVGNPNITSQCTLRTERFGGAP